MSTDLLAFLSGKRLLRTEIPYPDAEFDPFIKKGLIIKTPSILFKNSLPLCIRCGNTARTLFASHFCATCQKNCLYCRHCIRLGKTQECKPLYQIPTSNHTAYPIIESPLKWEGKLSLAQQTASLAVINTIQTKSSILLWAVCGAGKTEMLFEGIAAALERGERVLLATPRVDVVKELTPRFGEAFPSVTIASLYGGSKDHHTQAPFVIATTHQVMRFYESFDVVIIDEVDAFPFSYDKSLQYAITQARKPHSALIYLTATPTANLKKQKDLTTVYIPRRYHGYLLPVPNFRWCGNWRAHLKKNKLPLVLLKWLKERQLAAKPTLLFAPSIQLLHQCSTILQSLAVRHEAVHAADIDRHNKLDAFRNNEYSLLLTTTILERGVTIPNVDVAVLGAEDDVFTEAALVQIAGRVGRSADVPTGDVTFFHYGRTDAMLRARGQINWMNKREV
ncbi:DEAD/DEAH box helicase [Alkalihalophilus sp. As8PL]|uniref:DEAD/DEAH box helicase n=1 Tax=Alkalihalophilus sp. As8PL TaxID=3237103 RepID=A0AB39BPK8_9BACI